MRSVKILVLLSIAVPIFGCGGGGGGGASETSEYCHTIPIDSISCTSCTQVSDTGAAFDGHFVTFATIGTAGSGTFVANTAVQPGGSIAGVYFNPSNPQSTTITITTFLSGTQQETMSPATRTGSSDSCVSPQYCRFNDQGNPNFVGLRTTKDYDEIHAQVSNSAAGSLALNEICVQ